MPLTLGWDIVVQFFDEIVIFGVSRSGQTDPLEEVINFDVSQGLLGELRELMWVEKCLFFVTARQTHRQTDLLR